MRIGAGRETDPTRDQRVPQPAFWGGQSRSVSTVADPVEPHEPFRFLVTAVFTITGRGLVAAGVTERGVVRTGDAVEVIHGTGRTPATCEGVEMINGNATMDPRTIGLLLPALTKQDIGEGDPIVGAPIV